MRQSVRVILLAGAMMSVAATIATCGTQRIDVPTSDSSVHDGAVLFSQRCSGCHTLSFAGTRGSAPNVRTAQANSGPNFNQRCERPITRVLYAIENGGFSGAYMPQNIVVGQQAMEVAKFVATYAGRQAPKQVGIINCEKRSLGTLPAATGASSSTAASAGSPPSSTAMASVSARTQPTAGARVAGRARLPAGANGTASTHTAAGARVAASIHTAAARVAASTQAPAGTTKASGSAKSKSARS